MLPGNALAVQLEEEAFGGEAYALDMAVFRGIVAGHGIHAAMTARAPEQLIDG